MSYALNASDTVTRDQPLLLFYHNVFTTRRTPILTSHSEAELADGDETVCIGGVKIQFHRCLFLTYPCIPTEQSKGLFVFLVRRNQRYETA